MQVNVAGIRRNIKNLAHNYSDAQVKVREATSNDPWGPSATIMAEIADLTYNVVAFSEIMQMIWKRLNDHGKNWRHVYKALILLEYLINTGTEKVAQQCKENIFAIHTLREFVYYEEGKDQGVHVREKAKQLVSLLKDEERLKNERTKALKAKERFAQHASGFGSDGYVEGPTHRETPTSWNDSEPKVSEIEFVRPQTAGEEELQLQLAMAMSREEAEQEEAKRRSDDVRLQLALSQSEQDFKKQQVDKHDDKPKHSHLMDLLDISLGAASISSPPPTIGAVGGAIGGASTSSDPWGTSGRASSQLSDPWSRTSSPPADPWQPVSAAGIRPPIIGAAASTSTQMPSTSDAWGLHATSPSPSSMNAIAGIATGAANSSMDTWNPNRTQSPSVGSVSSNEGWRRPSNSTPTAGMLNGNPTTGSVDPWLPKPGSTSASAVSDPWLNSNHKLEKSSASLTGASISSGGEDPWRPTQQNQPSTSADPWAPAMNNIEQRPSPTGAVATPASDIDEFDVISNRNKTGQQLNNFGSNNNNNNNASLLEEMDPLATTKKTVLKTPQAFLGENSSLVNLDHLIKPVVPNNVGPGTFNPFSDTTGGVATTSKPNLFQQQMPPVPTINQLKSQPFPVTLNQDPWAPVNAANNTTAQNNSNNNIPWMKSEETPSNPFLT